MIYTAPWQQFVTSNHHDGTLRWSGELTHRIPISINAVSVTHACSHVQESIAIPLTAMAINEQCFECLGHQTMPVAIIKATFGNAI